MLYEHSLSPHRPYGTEQGWWSVLITQASCARAREPWPQCVLNMQSKQCTDTAIERFIRKGQLEERKGLEASGALPTLTLTLPLQTYLSRDHTNSPSPLWPSARTQGSLGERAIALLRENANGRVHQSSQ